ncbi:hypothetical protein BGZ65_007561 [Modicella reniformis]|uniref:Uncharacterized protein n=1 Tax=Modicella reniformis TaxID=1440133 RepID=A0A9P6MF83_9FUNG|nr:hypothetical protein BGZ65_007561 [Modicella reniformis]
MATAQQQQQQIYALSSLSPDGQAMDELDAGHTFESDDSVVPTLEQMGLENLSEMDVRMLLQQAYEVIQEKDCDLNMAAVMGQDLVESNTVLQAKYQHLLTQQRHQRMHRPRHLTPPRKIALNASSDAPTNTRGIMDETMDGDENWVDFEPSRSLSSFQTPPSSGSFRPSTSHSGRMHVRSRQDMEKLATLEDQNTQLQVKLDTLTKELKQGRRHAFKRHRRAEKDLKMVRDELDQSSTKVVDLEEQNGRLIDASRMLRNRRIMLKNQLPAPGSIPGSTMASIAMEMDGDEFTIQEMLAEDSRIFEELRDRLHSLERKNTTLQHQKVEADKKTQQVAQELSEAQRHREELLATINGLQELQNAYNEQSAHVQELENTVEELQNSISIMGSRFSQMNSPLMSPSVPLSPVQSGWGREDPEVKTFKTIMQGTTSPKPAPLKSPGLKGQQRPPRKTLLAELESEWLRNINFFGLPRVLEQHQAQQPIHLPGLSSPRSPMLGLKSPMMGLKSPRMGLRSPRIPKSPRMPKSPRALKDHRHDSESEAFSDDTGGRVKGWRKSIRRDMDILSMDEESVCESSSCVRRKRRQHRRYEESDTDGGLIESHGDDSDVERYQLRPRGTERNPQGCGSNCGDETDVSECSGPHHLQYRPSSPGCCCRPNDEYSDEFSYDEGEEDTESAAGWTHFIDHDASTYGYDKKRDGYYIKQKHTGLFGLFQGVFLLFRFFWRWCRFIFILSTALGIALYRGPDALLTDGR